jgi:RNA-directed DNA polymerase
MALLGNDEQFAGARFSLGKLWDKFDLPKAQRNVARLQARIVKAFQNGQSNKVKVLQRLLVRSLGARTLAVDRVTSSKGARTPGVDGQIWNMSSSKMAGALSLWEKGYKASPLRRVNIAKPGLKKKRPLGIPIIRDRAMQALHHMALDPISETSADANSYGFRKHRSTHDAIEQAFLILGRKNSATWILDADIAGCFDNICHDWMLQNIPMDETMLQQWLKCGYVETKGRLFPTSAGTPQGGIVSPCLCNMVLDGLEKVVKTAVKSGRQINFVRYADDFIVTARHRSDLENTILPAINHWLRARGLTLSEEKTRIRHIREGFDFLGQNLRNDHRGKLQITPSKKNVQAFLQKARATIKSSRGHHLGVVIGKLNPMIRGWANYHRHGVALERYTHVDHQIYQAVWRFLKRSHPNKSCKWIYAKYNSRKDPSHPDREALSFRYKTVDRDGKPVVKTVYLKAAATIKRVWHLKVQGKANPYDPKDRPYFKWLRGLRQKIKEGKWKPKWNAGWGS